MDKITTPPTWDEAKEAVLHNKATPIHELIYYFQPPAAAVNEMSRQELFRGIVQDILSKRQEEGNVAGGLWQKADRQWNEYPVGTKARQSWDCGYWTKTEHGWKWPNGSTFPRPGAADQVMLPSVKAEVGVTADCFTGNCHHTRKEER